MRLTHGIERVIAKHGFLFPIPFPYSLFPDFLTRPRPSPLKLEFRCLSYKEQTRHALPDGISLHPRARMDLGRGFHWLHRHHRLRADSLGDIVYVDAPKAGDAVTASVTFGSVESVKAVSDLYSPVSGTVTAVNEELKTAPDQINQDPHGTWIIKVRLSDLRSWIAARRRGL